MATLRYNECVAINPPASGLFIYYAFNATSLFDPNFSGAGHQPYGFDQIAQFYDHYTVHKARIKVRFNHGNTVASVPIFCSVIVDDANSTAMASPEHVMESGTARYRILLPDSSKSCRVSTSVNVKKFLGKNRFVSATAATGASPSENVYFILAIAGICGNSADPPAIYAQVQIEYDCEFNERKDIGQS